MNTGSSSQNPHHDMEINQVALREGLESEESDARHSAHGSTGSKRSRTDSRRMNLIQESVLRQEVTTQRSQDTLNNMTAMMQWQVNRQFRKDREAAMARIPNPHEIAGIPERGGIQAGHGEVAFPIRERLAPIRPEGPAPGQVPQNQQEPQPAPQQAAPQDHPMEILPKQPAVLPYRPRRMDPNPFPPPARGRRGRGGNYPYANNDRNRQGANWRNHPGLEEPEEHREEVLPRPYRAEPRFNHA
ncbi:unnamed protein product [Prunus armeniaca]